MADLSIAANNGDVGGGEVMQLALATAASDLGVDVQVIGMAQPNDLVKSSRDRGLKTIELPAAGRRRYLQALRAWRRDNPAGVLWCNGLVPAVATVGLARRVVHLHRAPEGFAQRALVPLARWRSVQTYVPSEFMRGHVAGAAVLPNWTAPYDVLPARAFEAIPRVGFLGRTTFDKGIGVLAEAVRLLDRRVELVIGGTARFADQREQEALDRALRPIEHQVRRLGWVSPEEFFACIDVAVFPSVSCESFGLVVAEAMATGVPFVISDAGALREVAGADHPWIAKKGDASALASSIDAVLECAPERRLAVVDAARERWQANYSPAAGLARFDREWHRVRDLVAAGGGH